MFMFLSVITRGGRYFLVAGLLYWKGDVARRFHREAAGSDIVCIPGRRRPGLRGRQILYFNGLSA
jgi:hypothetical protein